MFKGKRVGRLALGWSAALTLALVACSPAATPSAPAGQGATQQAPAGGGGTPSQPQQAQPTAQVGVGGILDFTAKTLPAPGPAGKRGGTINFKAGASGGTASDPHKGVAGIVPWAPISDSALEIAPWDLSLQPAIVQSWTVSPDGLTYTLKVRDDATFHSLPPVNGRAVTAADVAYSFMRASGKYNPEEPGALWPRSSALANLDKAEATDKSTVKVSMVKPNAGFLLGIADSRISIVPKEVVDANKDLQSPGPATMIGTGAFYLDKYSNETGIVYKANPKYWKKGPGDSKLPYVDQVNGLWVRDKATEIAAFQSGQLDYMENMFHKDADTIKKNKPDTVKAFRGGAAGCSLKYNLQKAPYNNIKVRKAFDLILDRQMFGDGHLGAGNWILASPVPYGHYPDWALTQDEVKALPGRKTGDARKADIAEAHKLLKEAGFDKGWNIQLSGPGTPGTAIGYLEYPLISIENIKRDFGDIGMTADFVNFGADQNKNVTEKRFEINWYCATLSTDPGLWMHEQFHSEGSRNYESFSDPKYDSMWEKQQAELDPAKRKAILKEMQLYVLDQVAYSVLVDYYQANIMQPYLKGLVPYMDGYFSGPVSSHLRYAWLDK